MARRRLLRQFFDYLDGGTYAEPTMQENVGDPHRALLHQRVLRDVPCIDLRTRVLEWELAMPMAHMPDTMRREMEVAMALTGSTAVRPTGREALAGAWVKKDWRMEQR